MSVSEMIVRLQSEGMIVSRVPNDDRTLHVDGYHPPILRGCPIGSTDAPDGGYHPADSLAYLCSRWVDPLLGGIFEPDKLAGEQTAKMAGRGAELPKWQPQQILCQTLCQIGNSKYRAK